METFFLKRFFFFLLSSDSRPLCCTAYLFFSPASSPGHFTFHHAVSVHCYCYCSFQDATYLPMAQLLWLLSAVVACAWMCRPLASGSLAPFTNGAELPELAGVTRRRGSPSGPMDRHRLSLRQLESMWHTSMGKEVRVGSFGSTAEQRNALLQLMNGPRKTIEKGAFLTTEYDEKRSFWLRNTIDAVLRFTL